MSDHENDAGFMRRALELAARGQGRVEPNPMVGAVIVRAGRIIGEGWHRRFGGPHAEIEALRACRGSARGATCYVTLEPCCHHGKTPPCTEALIAAGIRRVVAASRDPFPKVAGGGLRQLRRAGIRVETGLLRREAQALNAPYFKMQRSGTPWVILKWAQSLDGKIATRRGDSKWITSPAARRAAHELRGRVDAIIVGVGTVLADDPELTCRLARPPRVATRIVLDAALRTPPRARIVRTARKAPVMLVTTRAPERRMARFRAAGCEVLALPEIRGGIPLKLLLAILARRGMTNVLVEGGGQVLGAFFDQDLADEAVVFIAPRLIGGTAAPGPLGGVGPERMNHLPACDVVSEAALGPDRCIRMRLRSEIWRPTRR